MLVRAFRQSFEVGRINTVSILNMGVYVCCRPHITFISGANGSGKSAIMSALQVRAS